jgi:hypothetical protein
MTRRDCDRCGWRGGPGHSCRKRWGNRWVGIAHSCSEGSDGRLSHAYWVIDWEWKGDHHTFIPDPSLGLHTNVSRRVRLERLEAERMARYHTEEEVRWDDAA